MLDRRIWTPDETCFPFFISTAFNFDGSFTLCRFRTPDDSTTVIKKLSAPVGAINNRPKRTTRIVLVCGERSPVLLDERGLQISGALLKVRELDEATNNNQSFAVQQPSAAPYDLTLVLDGGKDWQFDLVNTGALSNIQFWFSGWTFESKPQ